MTTMLANGLQAKFSETGFWVGHPLQEVGAAIDGWACWVFVGNTNDGFEQRAFPPTPEHPHWAYAAGRGWAKPGFEPGHDEASVQTMIVEASLKLGVAP